MRPLSLAILVLAIAASSGCAVKKNFYATGGSRADGTVDMAYDFRQFEQPVINMDQAQGLAQRKCAVWGYRDAEAFGGKTQNCNQWDGWGNCAAGQVVIKYQCIGNLDAQVSQTAPLQAPAASGQASGSLNKDQWQQQQLNKLNTETGLSYEEYQRRYRQIMGQ